MLLSKIINKNITLFSDTIDDSLHSFIIFKGNPFFPLWKGFSVRTTHSSRSLMKPWINIGISLELTSKDFNKTPIPRLATSP
jgi:hypothetical protein